MSALRPVTSIRARRPGPALKLRPRPLREDQRAALLGEPDRGALLVAALPPTPEAGELATQIGERVRELQPRRARLEDGDRLLEQLEPLIVAECGRSAAQRPPQCPGQAHPPGRRHLLACQRARCLLSPSAASAGAANARQSPGHRRPCCPSRSPYPKQIGDALAQPALRDPQPAAGDQILVQIRPRLGCSELLSSRHKRLRVRQFAPFQLHRERYREQLEHREMPSRDQQQSGLGLDLGIGERTLSERDRRAQAMDDPLPRGMAFAPSPVECLVEQQRSELVALARDAAPSARGNRR